MIFDSLFDAMLVTYEYIHVKVTEKYSKGGVSKVACICCQIYKKGG